MKRLSKKKLNVITAIILTVITVGFATVCFIPDQTVMLTGGKAYSPIYNGNRQNNCVAIMINVYEGSDIVSDMLDVLKENGAKATFFIGGCWADDNEELVLKIAEEGHELGSHGYFHKDHSKLDEKGNIEEMQLTDNLIRKITGLDTTLFAPPSGAFSSVTLKIAEKMGYKTIMWSKDTVDWRDKSKEIVYNRATKNISAGDFVLMHPKEHTLQALPEILDYYKKIGLSAVTVSACIGE